ncbi:MAG: glucose-6-phosphate isomerase [Eubacteriales bacterium]|nr:glucose-6-phosphate isomerase [Eubacteriales bacterium]
MSRYESKDWKQSMKLRYDYNNMLLGKVDVESQHPSFQKKVGALTAQEIDAAMPALEKARLSIARKWGKPSRMMAWTKLPYNQKTVVRDILSAAKGIRKNFEYLVVFGIGGSALGPIAVQQALNHLHYNDLPAEKRNGPKLYVVDNVDPERMSALFDVIELEKTCFIIITKSGSTSETMSQTLIAFDALKDKLGEDSIRHQVIAVTDKAKGNLARIAADYGLKKFVVPDGVGGRFSELCPVGLLPAAACGIDIEEMLAGAAYMDELCREADLTKNLGYMAGLIAYLTMKKGKNIQVMIPYSDSLKYMSDWYAQLWAESLGKKYSFRKKVVHTGQTPVKALGVTDQHSQVQLYAEGPFDKVITFLGVDSYRTTYTIPTGFEGMPSLSFLSGHTMNELIQSEQFATEMALTHAGKLNQTITLPEVNAFTLGELMFFFEVQTTVCGELLGIDAFDQPGVEEGKINTYALLGRPGYEDVKKALDAQEKKEDKFVI